MKESRHDSRGERDSTTRGNTKGGQERGGKKVVKHSGERARIKPKIRGYIHALCICE